MEWDWQAGKRVSEFYNEIYETPPSAGFFLNYVGEYNAAHAISGFIPMSVARQPKSKLTMLSLVACVMFAGQSLAATLQIQLGSGSDSELQAEVQLKRLVRQYDIRSWIFTTEVTIDDEQFVPHSHPTLTINSRYLTDDHAQLATFLHEQFHWYESVHQEEIDGAIRDFRLAFPDVPAGREGARDENSTYLHLVICDLEFQALTLLLGKPVAEKVLRNWNHYSWIYSQVLSNPKVREINAAHGLLLLDPALPR